MEVGKELAFPIRILRSVALGGVALAGIPGCATQTCVEGVSGVSSIPGAEIFTPLVAVACIGAAHEVYMPQTRPEPC